MSWFVFVIRLADNFTRQQRDAVLEKMREAQIQVSNYFAPVHLQPFMVEKFGFKKGDFPITESIADRTIALPFYNNLTKDDIAAVAKTLKQILDKI
jgi:perosamine synthetase